MDGRSIFWEVHEGLPQQAPGSADTTRHLLSCCGPLPTSPAVADLGCGPGRSTLVLAEALPRASVTSVDLHQPFLDDLAVAASAAGVADRIECVRASMADLPFDDAAFDLIWSEGSIYLIGAEAGLRAWRRLLRPGGLVVITEATWFTDSPSPAATAFWADYPAMTNEDACKRFELPPDRIGDIVVTSTRRPTNQEIASLVSASIAVHV